MMSRVTYFILRAHTETGVSHSQHRKHSGEFFVVVFFFFLGGGNAGEWTGGVEIGKEEIPGSRHSKHGYILTYFRL